MVEKLEEMTSLSSRNTTSSPTGPDGWLPNSSWSAIP
jgi:hypothetical protein